MCVYTYVPILKFLGSIIRTSFRQGVILPYMPHHHHLKTNP